MHIYLRRNFRVDIKIAGTTLSSPMFPVVENRVNGRIIRSHPQVATSSLSSAILLLRVSDLFQKQFVSILLDLRYLNLFRIFSPNKNESIAEYTTVDLCNFQKLHIERQLLTYMNLDTSPNDASVGGCCRLAVLLFINTAFWLNFPPTPPFSETKSRVLKPRWRPLIRLNGGNTGSHHPICSYGCYLWVHRHPLVRRSVRGSRPKWRGSSRNLGSGALGSFEVCCRGSFIWIVFVMLIYSC